MLLLAVEGQCKPVSRPCFFQCWQRKLGLELGGALGCGPPVGNPVGFSLYQSSKESSKQAAGDQIRQTISFCNSYFVKWELQEQKNLLHTTAEKLKKTFIGLET